MRRFALCAFASLMVLAAAFPLPCQSAPVLQAKEPPFVRVLLVQDEQEHPRLQGLEKLMPDEPLNPQSATPCYGLRRDGDTFRALVGCDRCEGRWSLAMNKAAGMELDRRSYRCPDCRSPRTVTEPPEA